MPKKFRFSSPTVLRGDAPFLGATVQQWDDAFTGNMEKSLAEVKKLAISAAERNRMVTTGNDDQGRAGASPPVRFVDTTQTGPLPSFVTKTTLHDLLIDNQVDDAHTDQTSDTGQINR